MCNKKGAIQDHGGSHAQECKLFFQILFSKIIWLSKNIIKKKKIKIFKLLWWGIQFVENSLETLRRQTGCDHVNKVLKKPPFFIIFAFFSNFGNFNINSKFVEIKIWVDRGVQGFEKCGR